MKRLLSLLFVAAAACTGAQDAYIDDLGFDDLSGGKADGLLDEAPTIAFGETKTGMVGPDQLDVFRIELKQGQQIKIKQKVTSGDLAPHFTLFAGVVTKVSSETFQRTTKTVTKTYTVPMTVTHFIAIKPYQENGSGSYELTITCTGVCEGNEVPEPLSVEEQEKCIQDTRICAFAALPGAGSVSATEASTIFNRCLAEQENCGDACGGEGESMCNDIVAALPFYADASAACRETFEGCMVECAEQVWGSYDPDDMSDTSESKCFSSGFNGTCDAYARGHAVCTSGGYENGSNEECHARCESTTGAQHDDLGSICDEGCD